MRPTATLIVVCIATIALAADAPKSPLAVQARKTYDQQVKWADAVYEQAVGDAKKKRDVSIKASQADFTASLKKAMDVALKTKDVEEIKRLDEELKSLAVPPTSTPADDPLSAFHGTWEFRFSNQTTALRPIGRDNKVGDAVLKRVGGDTIIEHSDVIERLTVAGNRLFVEHFNPKSDYGRKTARIMAEGVRVRN